MMLPLEDVTHSAPQGTSDFPLEVPETRFDQRNEMFKRRTWDESVTRYATPFYTQVKYQDKYGYRQTDYALRTAAWNVEHGFGFGTMRSNLGMYSWDDIPEKARRYVEAAGRASRSSLENTRIVKRAARFFGASLVGVCSVHPSLVYSHELDLTTMEHRPLELPEACNHAVVMAVEMDYDACRHSPDAVSAAATGLGYSRQAVLANLLAAFIRILGYRAIPSGNDTAMSIPLAVAAGMGELGRMGLLVTEKFGPRVRLCKVFTDLPLVHDSYSPFGVKQFCTTCNKCAKHCPSQAIPYGDPAERGPSISNHSGVLKWYIDPEKCFSFWAKNWADCSNCIMSCPFNKPEGVLHDAARIVVRKFPALDRLLRWTDDALGYGRPLAQADKDFWES